MPPFRINARARGGGSVSCPLCRESLGGGGAVRACGGCEVSYHASCLEELGGCGTLGCERAKQVVAAPRTPAPSRPAPRETMSWGNAGALVALILLVVGAKVASHVAKSEGTSETPARRARELDREEVQRFVSSIEHLLRLHGERVWGGETEVYQGVERQAVRAYLRLRDSSSWTTPEQVQATLASKVSAALKPEQRKLGADLVRGVFGNAEKERGFGWHPQSPPSRLPPLSPRQQEEMAKATRLMAEGRDIDDPEVRKHIRAAVAAGLEAARERREEREE